MSETTDCIKCPWCGGDVPTVPTSDKHKITAVRCKPCDAWIPVYRYKKNPCSQEWIYRATG